MIAALVPLVAVAVYGIPLAVTCAPLFAIDALGWRMLYLIVAPLVFATSLIVVAGTISVPFRRAIVAGRHRRSLAHPIYGPRRVYGMCWTAVYYAGPIYQLALSLGWMRRLMFWLFGYRGSHDFIVYADTWIRDLPLLDIGRGAYLSNKATIGTNICLNNGYILVDRIKIGEGAMIGHLAMLGPGAVIGDGAEIGVGVGFGIRAQLGERGRIGPGCIINNGAKIGAGAEIGTMSYIGTCAQIAPGLRLPAGSRVPDRAIVTNVDDVAKLCA